MQQSFSQLAAIRQSVRKYSATSVEVSKLMMCIEAARLSPSASNAQPWTFVVADEPELLRNLAMACRGPLGSFNQFVAQAPVIVTIVIEKTKVLTEMGGRLKKKEYPLIDIGIAAGQFCLQAAELGLGTCMLGWFDEQQVKKLLRIPDDRSIGLMITVGYAPENYPLRKKTRKEIQNILRFNSYTSAT